MTWFEAVFLGIVEGLTEFLPISSTGHMIIASTVLGIRDDIFTKLFEVCVQFGAILSVVVLYWRKFIDFSKWEFYFKLFVALVPAIVVGVLFAEKIDKFLESPMIVAIALIVGGIILLFIGPLFKEQDVKVTDDEQITLSNALVIGLFQVLAVVPGVSRSAATIIGGLQQRLSRKQAAEFSFFLAVPTMTAATIKKLYDFASNGYSFMPDDINKLILGNIVAFVVAMFAIRTFIYYLQRNPFIAFGAYRIFAGVVVLTLILIDVIQ
jgi:undecaprenyl-diphosphatase